MKLNRVINGVILRLEKKGAALSGSVGRIYPGEVTAVLGLSGRKPPERCTWIRDYNGMYWEVSNADLREALKEQPEKPLPLEFVGIFEWNNSMH